MTRLCPTRLTWIRSLLGFHRQTLWRVPGIFSFLSPQSSKPIGYWKMAWKPHLPSQSDRSHLVFTKQSPPFCSCVCVALRMSWRFNMVKLFLSPTLTEDYLHWENKIEKTKKWAVPGVKRGFTPWRGCSGVSSKQLHGVVQPFSSLHFHPPSWRISSNLSLNSNTDNRDEFFKLLHRAASGALQLLFLSSSCEEFRSAPCDFVH